MSAILLLIGLFAAGHIEATATCNKNMDLSFIIDSSDSVCNGAWPCPKWDAIIQFCKDVVNSLTIGKYNTQVAFATLSTKIQVEFNLQKYTDQASVISAIGNVPYRGGELTDIVDLLSVFKMITGVYNPLISDRELVQNVVILVTDGVPHFPSIAYAITSALYQLTRQVALFAVCNTKGTPESPGCTEECARGVASFPQTANATYFLIDDYLKINQVTDTLVENFCAWPWPWIYGK